MSRKGSTDNSRNQNPLCQNFCLSAYVVPSETENEKLDEASDFV